MVVMPLKSYSFYEIYHTGNLQVGIMKNNWNLLVSLEEVNDSDRGTDSFTVIIIKMQNKERQYVVSEFIGNLQYRH